MTKIRAGPSPSAGTPNTVDDGLKTEAQSSGWLNEVRAIREVHCDAVSTVFDVGIARHPRVAFITMEFLHGSTLDKPLQAGPIYWRRSLAVARQVATARQACHAVEVTHYDLKPPNIFLTETGRVCVLDVGIAALGAEHHAPPRSQRPQRRSPTALRPGRSRSTRCAGRCRRARAPPTARGRGNRRAVVSLRTGDITRGVRRPLRRGARDPCAS